MSVTARKTKVPITSVIVSPINESVTFGPNNTIIFRISQSDLLYWLVQDSYFLFDVDWSFKGTDAPDQNLVIRGSGMFIDNVRVLHAGNEVYYQQYNIAQQILDYVKSGDDYLKANSNQWVTHEVYDKVTKNESVINNNLIIKKTDWTTVEKNQKCTKTGIVLYVSQILKCLSQCDNFPLKYVSQQIEIRFQLAFPADFVCAAGAYNFYDIRGNQLSSTDASTDPSGASVHGTKDEVPLTNYGDLNYIIKNVRLYMYGENIDPAYDDLIKEENDNGSGKLWKYKMPRINLRNMRASGPTYLVSNFQCITENTDEMFVWATRNTNLSAMIRPSVTNMNLRFGPYQIPQSPTSDYNYTKPSLYKSMIDDVLEYSTAYYTSSNTDYNNSYPVLPNINSVSINTSTDSSPNWVTPEHDTYLMLAGNFTTDDAKLGSNSNQWNSQYNLNYNLAAQETHDWIWVLAVNTNYVLTLREGLLSSTNL